MRNGIWWSAPALLAALVLAGSALAQQPGGRGGRFPPGRGGRGGPGPALQRALDDLKVSESNKEQAADAIRAYAENGRRLMDLADANLMLKMKEVLSAEEYTKLKEATNQLRRGPGGGRALTVEDLIERLMSFDKNKDGKITKDELPERMQDLIAKGDTNKDGALDKDEIKKLAAELAKDESSRGGRFGGGRGGRGGPIAGFPPGALERAVNDLKLTDKKKETATAAIKTHHEDLHKLTALARADLLLAMSDVLSADDLKKFQTAVERQPDFGERPFGSLGGPFGRGRP